MQRSFWRFNYGLITLLICLGFWSITAFGEGEPFVRVHLTASFPTAIQVTANTPVYSLSSSGSWQAVDNTVLTRDQTWTVGWDKENNRIMMNSDGGGQILSDRPLRFIPDTADGSFRIAGRNFGGMLELYPGKTGLDVYNRVGIEDYVEGVLAGESIPGWPIEALKAQAVASRTFALCQLRRHGDYDFCDLPHCQHYVGITKEPSFIQAVSATKGQVLTYNNKLIWAFYHASSGGRTENNEDVWGGESLPYLRSVEDYDQSCDKSVWPAPYLMSAGEFLNRLGCGGGQSCTISPVVSPKNNTVVAYTFQRSGDTKPQRLTREEIRWKMGFPSPRFQIRRINGEDIRLALNQINGGTVRVLQSAQEGDQIHLTLRLEVDIPGEVLDGPVAVLPSEILFITGKGSGHGVGLSQWGSQAMALTGKNYQEILHHYYSDNIAIVQYGP